MQIGVSVGIAVGEVARVMRVREGARPSQRVKVAVGALGPVLTADFYVVPIILDVFPDAAPSQTSA